MQICGISANFMYHILAEKTISTSFNKHRIRNFQPNDVILISIFVLNSFEFRLLCQAYVKNIMKRN